MANRQQKQALDDANARLRQSPLYAQFMRSIGVDTTQAIHLSKDQRRQFSRFLASNGMAVPKGLTIDAAGNMNQPEGFGHELKKWGPIVGAAALAAFGIPGFLPGLLTSGGAAAGAGAGAAAASGGVGSVVAPGVVNLATAASTAAAAAGTGAVAAGVTTAATASLLTNPLFLLGAGSTALDVVGRIKAGNAARAAGEAEGARADYNAGIADQQAGDALSRGREDENTVRVGVQQVIGAQRAAYAGQGVAVTTGSARDSARDATALGEADIRRVRLNAAREAFGFRSQAEDLRMQGNIARRTGKAAQSASRIGAAQSVLGGTTSLLAARYGWGK